MATTSQVINIIKNAERVCSESGSKLTDKRKNVLSVLIESERALSPYEISDIYKDVFKSSIPVMSVYRMLDFLVDNDLAHRLKSINKYIACSHIACDHSHEIPQFMICDNCEDVREIGIKKNIINAIRTSLNKANFTLGNPQLELHGLCQSCSAKS